MSDLDSTTLREYLSYDPDTGVFTWRKQSSDRTPIGSAAGSLTRYGYISIGFRKRSYYAHRLAWLYVYGRWPMYSVDHINGNKLDNRIENLRDVPQIINTQNASKPRGANPYLGVTRKRKKWAAYIRADGRSRNLGSFDTPEAARDAYIEAKRKLHAGCTI